MRAIIQRVNNSQVIVEGKTIANIGKGMLILLGIGPEDDETKCATMAKKIAQLRIFEDEQGKMNLSLLDTGGAAIVVIPIHPVRRYTQRQPPFICGGSRAGESLPVGGSFCGRTA